ncbi:MAG: LapA family protein [Rhodococcus sp. (in: high G+C Gram-positive bacteria)]
MATRADDSHETSPNESGAGYPGEHSASGDLSPITTPDSDGHSAPDPEFVPGPQASSSTDIAHTRTAALWTGLVVGAIVLIVLLVFIVQNLDSVTVQIFAWQLDLPLGISMLLAAIAGALVMALVGGARILQFRRAAKKK